MLVGVLFFVLCVLAFVVLAQHLNHASSKSEWMRMSNEYSEMLDRSRDRLRLEQESSQWLRDELKRATQTLKFRSPDVACTVEVRQLFERFGGPERTAAIIAENYAKLDEKYHELQAELENLRERYENFTSQHGRIWPWLTQAHRKRKNFQRLWRRYRNETRSLREELHLVRGLYEDAAEV